MRNPHPNAGLLPAERILEHLRIRGLNFLLDGEMRLAQHGSRNLIDANGLRRGVFFAHRAAAVNFLETYTYEKREDASFADASSPALE